ncbi:hypothetical protein C8R42DRAFT_655072 [Lentinula raphanica]|nr:hypothetical protein C8R42DRAFT_655072 [Lentinula raphanica]
MNSTCGLKSTHSACAVRRCGSQWVSILVPELIFEPSSSTMGLLLSLSPELLHAIIEDIVYMYSPVLKTPNPELLALSVTNWQLREICLPFLFINIEIRDFMGAARLEKHIQLCSKFTKNMIIGPRIHVLELAEPIIIRNLPKLKRLSNAELHDCGVRTTLFRAMLAHPTLTSVLIHKLPGESVDIDDLSKIILKNSSPTWVLSPNFEKCLNRGMRLMCLELSDSEHDLLDKRLSSRISNVLKESRMRTSRTPVLFNAWLSKVSSTYSILNQLWFINDDYDRECFAHTPPFLSSFNESLQQQDIVEVIIRSIGLHRTIGQSEWYVMGLTLIITFASNTSLKEILTLVTSSFPKLGVLDLHLHFAEHKVLSADVRRFQINLAPVFTQFLYLRSLSLRGYGEFEHNYFSKYLPELLRSSPLLTSIFSPSLPLRRRS